MANILKKEPGDIGRKEIIDFLKKAGVTGWSDSNFNVKLQQFCDDYKLDCNLFYLDSESEKAKILIRNEYKDLALAMIANAKNDPYIIPLVERNTKSSLEKVMKYHAAIIDLVENQISPDLRYLIQSSRVYRAMLNEHVSMEAALGKINEVITALALTSSEVRGRAWKGIYEAADVFLYNIFKMNNQFEEEKKNIGNGIDDEINALIAEVEACSNAINKSISVQENIEKRSELLAKICECYATQKGIGEDTFLASACENISEFLATILRKDLLCNKEAENIQIHKNGELYHVYDDNSKDAKFLEIINEVLSQNIAIYGDVEAKKAALLQECDEEINELKSLPKQIETLEKDTLQKLVSLGIEPTEKWEIEKCNEYSDYVKMIRRLTEKRTQGKMPFAESLLAIAYNELKK